MINKMIYKWFYIGFMMDIQKEGAYGKRGEDRLNHLWGK